MVIAKLDPLLLTNNSIYLVISIIELSFINVLNVNLIQVLLNIIIVFV